jgi:hypothetical protein
MSDKSMITRVAVLDLMCQVVSEFGVDHVYKRIPGRDGSFAGCYNWDIENNCPSCLIGHVVYRLGASPELLTACVGDAASSLISKFVHQSGLRLEYGVMDVLGAAQQSQDDGRTWGEALRDALIEHLEIGLSDIPEPDDVPMPD